MFYSLTGKVVFADASCVAIDCGGVAYRVATSLHTLKKITGLGDTVTVYTYLSVREDAMELFGFADNAELEFFKMLIGVSGVGPKAAIAILSTFTPEDVSFSIASGDVKRITGAPGVGPKLAQRIVLELKDKMAKIVPDKLSSSDFVQTVIADASGNKAEAVSALIALGYSQTEASAAVSTLDPNEKVEMLVKQGLRQLMRG
jgi:Holliday junction DNA helicase RuvA